MLKVTFKKNIVNFQELIRYNTIEVLDLLNVNLTYTDVYDMIFY